MRWYQFKYINHTPLWKRQKEDDPYLPITLPVSLFGMVTQFFFNIIFVMAWLNHELIIRVEQHPTKLNLYLENEILLILISIATSFLIIVGFNLFSNTFSQYNFFNEFRNQVSILNETLSLEQENMSDYKIARQSLFKELAVVFILGQLAGFYYSIYYSILYLMLYFFLVFLIVNMTSLSISVTVSMLLTWLIIAVYLIFKKLKVEEISARKLNPHADYTITERNVEILKSNLPPIICNGCRSYISAISTICRVCGDPVEENIET